MPAPEQVYCTGIVPPSSKPSLATKSFVLSGVAVAAGLPLLLYDDPPPPQATISSAAAAVAMTVIVVRMGHLVRD